MKILNLNTYRGATYNVWFNFNISVEMTDAKITGKDRILIGIWDKTEYWYGYVLHVIKYNIVQDSEIKYFNIKGYYNEEITFNVICEKYL